MNAPAEMRLYSDDWASKSARIPLNFPCSMRRGAVSSLSRLLTRRGLRRLADPGSFERGVEYAAQGRVHHLHDDGEVVVATVMGGRPYRVRLWPDGEEAAHVCTCPLGEDGVFCKHCVAVGLVWIAAGSGLWSPKGPPPALDVVRARLAAQSKDDLVELIMEQAAVDERLRRRLALEAAD
jgi:uncharacterized Zn finger protein